MSRLKNNRGFTLIELMVTIALLAIFASVAVPSFTQFIQNNQVQAKADEVKRFLEYARGQAAINRRTYEVVVDETEWQIKSSKGVERKLEFNIAQAQARTNIPNDSLTFNPSGSANNAVEIAVCYNEDSANGYLIEVQRSGSIKMQLRGTGVPSKCNVGAK